MKLSALNKLIATSFAWNLVGNLISKGSTFLVSVFAARMLGVIEFGKIAIIQQTLAVFLVFSVMGLSVTAIKYVASNRMNGRNMVKAVTTKVTVVAAVLSLFFGFLLFIFSERVSVGVVGSSELAVLLKLCSVVLLVGSINQVQFGILSGLGAFRKIAISNVISGVVNIPLTMVLIYFYELHGFVLSVVSSGLITLIFNRFFINKIVSELEDLPTSNQLSLMDVVKFSIPNLLSGIFFSLSSWFSIVILSRVAGLGDVSIFNAASQIFGIAYLFPTMLAQVVMSLSASSPEQKEVILKSSIFSTVVFSLVVCAFIFFLSERLMGLYRTEFVEHSKVLIALLPSLVVLGISNQIDHFAVGQGWIKQHFYLTAIFSISLVGFSLILSSYGALGIAIGKFIAHLVKLLVSLPVYKIKYAESQKVVCG